MDARTAAILEVIRALPPRTVTTTIRTPRTQTERTFVGASLFDYAVQTKLFASKMGGGGLANGYFMLTAEDGVRSAVALAEVWPSMTGKDVLLAYEQDGEPIRAGVRLVITGDHLSGRSLSGVVTVEPRRIDRAEPVASSGHVELHGLLERPTTIDAGSLAALPSLDVTTVAVTGHGGQSIAPRQYSGARLFGLIDGAGIRLDPEVNEPFLSKVVVATSADGHAVIVAGGEIEPRFMNGDIIITADGGGLRLMVPFDRKPGRWAKDLVSIELREG